MLLKQARVPKLVEQRTNYASRDFNLLPINPFDGKEWPSYISEAAPVGKGGKAGKEYKEEGSFNTNPSEESFGHTVCPTSGLLARGFKRQEFPKEQDWNLVRLGFLYMVSIRVFFAIKLRTVEGFTFCWMRMFPFRFSVFEKLRLTVCHACGIVLNW